EHAELHAEIELARVTYMQERSSPDVLRDVAQRAIDVFEAAGDSMHLADAWQLMGIAELAALDRGAQLRALFEARKHAIESGDIRRQIEAWNEVGGSMLFGRTPVTEVLEFLDDELAWGREHGLAAIEADALLGGPYLDSRLGRFDEARDKLERSASTLRSGKAIARAPWRASDGSTTPSSWPVKPRIRSPGATTSLRRPRYSSTSRRSCGRPAMPTTRQRPSRRRLRCTRRRETSSTRSSAGGCSRTSPLRAPGHERAELVGARLHDPVVRLRRLVPDTG